MCLVLAVVAAMVLATASRAEDDDPYPVKTVSYTTGPGGAKLTWLPYRPSAGAVRHEAAEPGVSRAQFEAPAVPNEDAAGDPVQDPFGDKSSSTGATAKPVAGSPKPAESSVAIPVLPVDAPANSAAPKSLPKLWVAKEKQSESGTAAQGSGPQIMPSPDQKAIPPLDQELATTARPGTDECPPTAEFKPIAEISNQIAPKEGNFPPECPIKSGDFVPRAWSRTNFAWTASGLCHKPLYFEDVQLERYGHSWGPYLQPIISQGHFFLTVPILPYLMGVEPPCECMYTLGYYRPGSCAPYMIDPVPISVRAGLLEAGAWTGAAALLP